MDLFTVNWEMVDPTDSKVSMSLQGDASSAIEILGSRKTIIEQALERGWTFNTNPLGKPAQASNERSSESRGAPKCQHGVMQWKSDISKKSGKPYKGWFCPAKQCDPKFIRDRMPARQDYEPEPPEYGEYR